MAFVNFLWEEEISAQNFKVSSGAGADGGRGDLWP